MTETRDWASMQEMGIRLLMEKTGEDLATWNGRVAECAFPDPESLEAWLTRQGINGYAQSLLVWEHFGYPDFLLASAHELIEGQYRDRPQLKPVYEALVEAACALGDVVVQARKTYVSLMTPRRTFARIQPKSKGRLVIGLRLEGQAPGGRFEPCRLQDTMPVQVSVSTVDEIDAELRSWLQRAHDENR